MSAVTVVRKIPNLVDGGSGGSPPAPKPQPPSSTGSSRSRANICKACTTQYEAIQRHIHRPNELTDADVFPRSGVYPIFLTQVLPSTVKLDDEEVASMTYSIKTWFLETHRVHGMRVFIKVVPRENQEKNNVWETHVCILIDPSRPLRVDDKDIREMFELEATGFEEGWAYSYTSPDDVDNHSCIASACLRFFAELLNIHANFVDPRDFEIADMRMQGCYLG
ncbi:hypothetical protein BDW74DRAFT_176615 [Aspergillus multicolor]|uniref:uncharacterized protein n=1 Tax=Aspergillus multicolor TaxID=41759 RepID=UPI003CCDE48C